MLDQPHRFFQELCEHQLVAHQVAAVFHSEELAARWEHKVVVVRELRDAAAEAAGVWGNSEAPLVVVFSVPPKAAVDPQGHLEVVVLSLTAILVLLK